MNQRTVVAGEVKVNDVSQVGGIQGGFIADGGANFHLLREAGADVLYNINRVLTKYNRGFSPEQSD